MPTTPEEMDGLPHERDGVREATAGLREATGGMREAAGGVPQESVRTPADLDLITRREAVRRVSILLGGIALVGGSGLITGCRNDREQQPDEELFSADDIAFLDEVADTILPETSTPGAKAARTGAFMALMVTDTYDKKDQEVFREGIRKLDAASRKMHDTPFMSATPA